MDDWQMIVFGLAAFFFLILFLLIWLVRDQSRLAGQIDALRDDRRLMREEMDSLRTRLKDMEVKQNGSN